MSLSQALNQFAQNLGRYRSPSYDFDACGDILAMAKAVGVMTENMRTDRCDNTQCDGSRCKGNTMFRLELDTENRRVHRRRHAR